jgi:hypothetical protein
MTYLWLIPSQNSGSPEIDFRKAFVFLGLPEFGYDGGKTASIWPAATI